MIHTEDGVSPGSPPPLTTMRIATVDLLSSHMRDAADRYLSEKLWGEGLGLAIVGPPKSGKTFAALAIARAARDSGVAPDYWAERHFLADMKRLRKLEDVGYQKGDGAATQAVWAEYVAWERGVVALRAAHLLVFDDLGQSATSWDRYDVECLVQDRRDRSHPSIYCANLSDWHALPEHTISAIESSCRIITLSARTEENDDE